MTKLDNAQAGTWVQQGRTRWGEAADPETQLPSNGPSAGLDEAEAVDPFIELERRLDEDEQGPAAEMLLSQMEQEAWLHQCSME